MKAEILNFMKDVGNYLRRLVCQWATIVFTILDGLALFVGLFCGPNCPLSAWHHAVILGTGFVIGNIWLFSEQERRISQLENNANGIVVEEMGKSSLSLSNYDVGYGGDIWDNGGLPRVAFFTANLLIENKGPIPSKLIWAPHRAGTSILPFELREDDPNNQEPFRGLPNVLEVGTPHKVCLVLKLSLYKDDPVQLALGLRWDSLSPAQYRIAFNYHDEHVGSKQAQRSIVLEGDYKELRQQVKEYWREKGIHDLLLIHDMGVNAKDENGCTPLLWAAQLGHTEVVQALADDRARINLPNSSRTTPLIKAAYNGHEEIVRMLIRAGADVNISNSDGETALIAAASRTPTTSVIQELLDAGAVVNVANKWGMTALAYAVQHGYFHSIVKHLIDAKANVNSKDHNGKTVLMWAADPSLSDGIWGKRYRSAIVGELIASGADVSARDKDGNTSLHYAIQDYNYANEDGNLDIAKKLIEAKIDVNAKNNRDRTSLMDAAWAGNLDLVQLLTECGADVDLQDNQGHTALLDAAARGHFQVVEHLVEKQADVNLSSARGVTPLALVILYGRKGYKHTAHVLRQARATKHGLLQATFTRACARGEHERVNRLIEVRSDRVDLNAELDTDYSSLKVAMKEGHFHIVRTLISRGASTQIKDTHGSTLLMLAVRAQTDRSRREPKDLEIFQILLDSGLDINAKDNGGTTALMLASMSSDDDCLLWLLQRGANPKVQANNGMTALMHAARQGSEKVVQALVSAGAILGTQDKDGKTFLDYAKFREEGFRRFLQKVEASSNQTK